MEFWLCTANREPVFPIYLKPDGSGEARFPDTSGVAIYGMLHKRPELYVGFTSTIPPTATAIFVPRLPFMREGRVTAVAITPPVE